MVVDLFLVYQFIRRLATPFEKWPAYEAGVIDKKGNILKGKNQRNLKSEKDSFGIFDLMILKLKKLLAKLPGGSSNFASYAAALFLIKEWKHFTNDSMLNESISEENIDQSLDLFFSRYNHYNTLSENVNSFLDEKLKKSDDMGTWIKDFYDSDAPQFKGKSKAKRRQMAVAAKLDAMDEARKPQPLKWKKAGPNGEKEITFPTGRRFKIEKQYDENIRHKGEWKVMEWDPRSRDWEWHETFSPQWYAKEKVMELGKYDSKGKKVTESATNMRTLKLINKIKKSGVVKSGSMSKNVNTKPTMKEEPTNSVGSGAVAGLGVGPQGEPGLTPAQMKKYKKKNKGPKRLRDIIGANT